MFILRLDTAAFVLCPLVLHRAEQGLLCDLYHCSAHVNLKLCFAATEELKRESRERGDVSEYFMFPFQTFIDTEVSMEVVVPHPLSLPCPLPVSFFIPGKSLTTLNLAP